MSLKILFMGTPDFAVPILRSIHETNHQILSVYTQPAKKKSRGQKIFPSPISEYSKKLKISVRCPTSLKEEDEYEYIKKLNINVAVVVAYGKILPTKILNLPDIKFLNIHASILPKWRGAAPIQRAIMNMDKETGISIMKIVPDLDAGPVMKINKIKIDDNATYETLSMQLSSLASSMIVECLDIIEKKKEIFIPQNSNEATYAKKIDKTECRIKWRDTAKNIVAKINAFYPNPGSWFDLNGTRIKVIKAKVSEKKGSPGEILDTEFTVACLDNAVQILELKKEGKKSMSSINFLKGNKLEIGSILNDL